MQVSEINQGPEKVAANYKNKPYRLPLRAMFVLIMIVTIAESIVLIKNIYMSDYLAHIQLAAAISEINFSYPLYHYLTYAFDNLVPFVDIYGGGILTGILSYVVLAAVIATSMYRQMRGRHPWIAVAVTLALLLSAPILIFNLHTGQYFGYQHSHTYHSPTTAIMRPLALMIFLYVACSFIPPVATWRQIGVAAFLAALLNLAKPNYSLAILPVAGLIMVYRFSRRLFVDYKMLVAILAVITFVLAAQYLIDFASKEGGIAFKPFFVLMEYRNLGLAEIVIKQLLSIVFPLIVLVLYWRTARHDVLLMLAWACFIFGWFYALTLVDVALAADNNFYWTGEITLFVLFFASVHFWLRQMGGHFNFSTRRAQIVMAVWTLHLASGVFWYALQVINTTSNLT